MAKTGDRAGRPLGQPVLRRDRRGLRRCEPDFALLGKVTKGQDVVDKISVVAVGPDEAPTEPVVIRQIRITES